MDKLKNAIVASAFAWQHSPHAAEVQGALKELDEILADIDDGQP